MKLKQIASIAVFLTCTNQAAVAADGKGPASVSYAIGYNMATSLKEIGAEINTDEITQGFKDTYAGKPMIKPEEAKELLQKFETSLREKMQAKMELEAAKNEKDAKEFFVKNAKVKGVKTLPSGVQYLIVTSGKGNSPSDSDLVTVHYKGSLLNGTVFDNSYERKEPAKFPVNAIIKGWQETLKMMKPGDKWIVFIPPELAYGKSGAGQAIPPNSALTFEIELISIEAAPTVKAEATANTDTSKQIETKKT